jgi:hypothetical protein
METGKCIAIKARVVRGDVMNANEGFRKTAHMSAADCKTLRADIPDCDVETC